MGGAMGNVIDRCRFGAVADFLDFHIGIYHWPAFNIADSAIFIGVVLLCIHSMFTVIKKQRKAFPMKYTHIYRLLRPAGAFRLQRQ